MNGKLFFIFCEVFSRGGNIVLMLLLPYVIADKELYGRVSLIIALEQLLFTVSMFGYTNTILKLYSRFKDKGKFINSYKRVSKKVFSLVVLLSTIPLYFYLDYAGFSSLVYILMSLMVYVYFYTRVEIELVRERAANNYLSYSVSRLVYQLNKLVFVLLFLWLYKATISFTVSLALSAFLSYLLLKILVLENSNFQGGRSYKVDKVIYSLAIPLVINSLMNILLSYQDRFILAAKVGIEELAIYNFSYFLGGVSNFGLSVASLYFLPKFYAMRRWSINSRLYLKKVLIFMLAISGAIGLIIILIFPKLSSLFYPEYSDGYHVLIIIASYSVIQSFYLYFNHRLIMVGKVKVIPVVMLFSLLLNFVLNIFLIDLYNIEGAAISTLASSVAMIFILFVFTRFRCGL